MWRLVVMAGRGRGRGAAAFSFNIDALGIGRGNMPEARVGPNPLFPVSSLHTHTPNTHRSHCSFDRLTSDDSECIVAQN